jgi:hypothetical protein
MLRRVALVRTEVSEERMPSITRMTTTGELGTTLAVTNNCNVGYYKSRTTPQRRRRQSYII